MLTLLSFTTPELSHTMSLAGNFVNIVIAIKRHIIINMTRARNYIQYSSFRLNKNRDPINDTVVDLLKKSKTCPLMLEIYMDHPGQTKEEEDLPPPGHRRGKKRVVVKSKTAAKMANFKTVCSYFRDQLNNLVNMLMSTEPSFIRCIVPNNHKKPGKTMGCGCTPTCVLA